MHKHPKPNRKRTTRTSLQHPKAAAPKTPPRTAAGFGEAPDDSGGFISLLLARISWEQLESLKHRKHGGGRRAHVLSRAQLLVGLLFHFTVGCAGSFGEHLFLLLGIQMAESSLSDRRQALPFELFKELLQRLLRPIAQSDAPKSAYYQDLALTAIDGVCFSLPNTPQVNGKLPKGGNQKGRAAFAKLHCAALVELLMHNPLAAAIGRSGESEWKLALELLDSLPQKCLLLADRLYGCGAFLLPAAQKLKERLSHFVVRAKEKLQVVRRIKTLGDGSQLVEIQAFEPGDTHRVAGTLVVREIRATVRRRGFALVKLRLWTSLLDWKQAPAQELVALYIQRWEHELYFRELKHALGINDLLRSQTVETAAQEVAAMIIGSSLIAHERSKFKPGEELSHRISFIKLWETLEPLWLTLLLGADILSQPQKQQLCDRFYVLASRRIMPKKRTRSCPRVMRQPVLPWPRKRNQKGSTDPLKVSITRADT